MIVIGITGSIGMGKSTIALMLKYFKIPIHDSDETVKLLLDKNILIIDKIAKKWPSCITNSESKKYINKNILGKIVFNDSKEKKKLEKLIHPYVTKSRNIFLENNNKRKKTIVGIDVPLMYETNTDKICDYIFLASASKKNQQNRVLKRPGMSLDKFNKIKKNQLSNFEKKKKKPIIISTDYGKFVTFTLLILNLLLIIVKKESKKNERSSIRH